MGTIMAWDKAPFNHDTKMEEEFLRLKEKHNIKTVIETGSFEGRTTRFLADNFENVMTVEINETYYAVALQNLQGLNNVTAYLGDTLNYLGLMLNKASEKGNFIVFFDSHWGRVPLLGELEIIRKSGLKPSVCCIHDFFVDGKSDINNPSGAFGFDLYPEQGVLYNWDFVKEGIESIYGRDGYERYFNSEVAENSAQRGCLFVTLKN